ncbi:MAG: DoxX family protein [Bacteroidota bacterium]
MTTSKPSSALNIALWVLQILLAAAFGMAGFLKVSKPMEDLLAAGMTFVSDYSMGTVRFIGICELAGAVGMILPTALRIRPILTPLAAAGFAVLMVLAIFQHVSRQESFVLNVALFLFAAFVVWGRLVKAPVQQR